MKLQIDAESASGDFIPLAAGEAWFCVQTQSNRERLAQINLRKQGFRSFMPQLMKTVRHARKTRTIKAPLFPRYLFVSLNMTLHQWRSINGSFGVISLVMEGARPKAVPPGVVESLQTLMDETEVIDLRPTLTIGGSVRMLTGPFADLIGRLIGLDGHGRAQVLMEVMGGERTVNISSRDLVNAT